jgi:spoIIIJ-associated protein
LQDIENTKKLLFCLIKRMGVEAEIRGYFEEGSLHLEIEKDNEGILVGKHGRTLEALKTLINRMINRRMKEPVRVELDIGGYRKRRMDSLGKLAGRLGERAKKEGKAITVGPFNAQERRIIHIALQEDPLVKTESIGEGPLKKISILPRKSEGEGIDPLE